MTLFLIIFQWRIPETEIERLFRAESQEQQKRILENFAKDLPITNRYETKPKINETFHNFTINIINFLFCKIGFESLQMDQ